eukprot:NODE_2217_length_1110_cov_78.310275_g2199_i0.p1 GENE.NODE_2217_length_1110_cov_78.310275_g2199_i0~~NODE_2217_length_1110_cov_78.310275_g2199_i0.p1  ORF type:complete len:322 (+),score=44.51 NODE_2217_length_1110_cov_78.310275_g2199_i0:103-1068(+)
MLGTLAAVLCVCQATATLRPTTAILTAPVSAEVTFPGKYYAAASYFKFAEGAGGRAAPIVFDIPQADLQSLHAQVNAVLFPGGGSDLSEGSTYREFTTAIYNLTVAAAAKGEWVPLWGTCLGMQALAVIASNRFDILSHCDSENVSLPLEFNQDCLGNNTARCRLFGADAPSNIMQLFADTTKEIAFNNHHDCVATADFLNDPVLSTQFTLLATSKDRNGKSFVAAFESKTMPIYATQFHPEKPIYEWTPSEVIPHTVDAIDANSYTARFLNLEARKNDRAFKSTAEAQRDLVYAFTPTYTGSYANELQGFEQCYFFNATS